MLRAAVGIAGSMAALRASLVIAAGAWAATFMSTSAGTAGTAASAAAGTAPATVMSSSTGTAASTVMSTATCLAEQRAVWRREGQGRRGQRT